MDYDSTVLPTELFHLLKQCVLKNKLKYFVVKYIHNNLYNFNQQYYSLKLKISYIFF